MVHFTSAFYKRRSVLALNVLWVVRAGTYFGIDGWLVDTEIKQRPLRFVLG